MMKNGIFLIGEPGGDYPNDNPIGVLKKVYSQVEALNSADSISCRMINLPSTRWRYIFNLYKGVLNDEKKIDFMYVRRIMPVNKALIALLRKIKITNPCCKIIYEIPTYPYDGEHKTILSRCGLLVDKIYRKQLKEYVDKIITVSNDDVIFGISTIKIKNGIKTTDIPIRKPEIEQPGLHCIVVAQFQISHGYDRFIAGLNNYYKGKWVDKVYVHLVGNGREISKYKALVRKYALESYCIFYGTLYGFELGKIFNKCHLGICPLGAHRVGLRSGSFLKSREYLARGLPIVSSTKIDIIPDGFEYCMYVPEDETPVNIMELVNFYNNIYNGNDETKIINTIRKFAEENCDMAKTMVPVINYINDVTS
jgi:hypothetical protein